MNQLAQTGLKQNDSVVDADVSAPPRRFEFSATAAKTGPSLNGPAAAASLVPLDQGLYALEIGSCRCLEGRISGVQLPFVQVSAPLGGREQPVEIIDIPGGS